MANNRRASTQEPQQSASLEDYLEAILMISSGHPSADAGISELGAKLGVSKPSVTMAVRRLVAQGLVEHERYGRARLTPSGRHKAEEVARLHQLLVRFLRDILGIDRRIAEIDACNLEHHLSKETAERLGEFVEFLSGDGKGVSGTGSDFVKFMSSGKRHAELVRELRSQSSHANDQQRSMRGELDE